MNIIDYHICGGETRNLCELDVKARISEGWQPFGSLQVSFREYSNRHEFEAKMIFSQAMVKYAPVKEQYNPDPKFGKPFVDPRDFKVS